MKPLSKRLIHFPMITTLLALSWVGLEINTSFALPQNQSEQSILDLGNQDYLALFSVRASEITAGTRNTKYYFTINIPKYSRPLQKINIVQRGGLDTIRFKRDRIQAYVTGITKQHIKNTEIKSELNRQGITVIFDSAVEPGQKLTLVMGVEENPLNDGNYLFGVTVFSQGESETGQSLGVGRLRITSAF